MKKKSGENDSVNRLQSYCNTRIGCPYAGQCFDEQGVWQCRKYQTKTYQQKDV